MNIIETPLKDVFIIKIEPIKDMRGYFIRTFCKEELAKYNIDFSVVQTSQSLTKERGTIRGLHFQKPPKEEKKIIQCISGSIFDVIVNIDQNSEQFGKYFSIELSEKNQIMLYVPEGYAHGFQTLTNNCLLQYYIDEFYTPSLASGYAWNDPFFNIKWPITPPVTSPRDSKWPFIK